jgi:homogentisate 1,2-dioxygenase
MSGHGPDSATVLKAQQADTSKPQFVGDTMAFMFETRLPLCPTPVALALPELQHDYQQCWSSLPKQFRADRREAS